jgi:hypothetical protein
MRRTVAWRATWIAGGGLACLHALVGCEAVLDVGNLTERGGSGAGSGVSTGMGSGASTGSVNVSGSGASAVASGAASGSSSGATTGAAGGSGSGSGAATGVASGSASGSSSGGVGGSGPAPSCKVSGAGMTNCGASSESCCTSIDVTGGTYYRTYTNNGTGATGEADPATVSSFRLDKYLALLRDPFCDGDRPDADRAARHGRSAAM